MTNGNGLKVGDTFTVEGVFDDHLLTKLSTFIVENSDDPNMIKIENADPKLRGRMPYYDEDQNTVKNPPHPFPNGYPKG
jgi:hypothetical protein